MNTIQWILVIVITASMGYGIAAGITLKIKEGILNIQLRNALNKQREELDKRADSLDEYERAIKSRDMAFKQGIITGRHWLANFIADADYAIDSLKEESLRIKSHPAIKTADIIATIKSEKRERKANFKFLEYQLKAYEEYFPFLEEYRDFILDERIHLTSGCDNQKAIEQADPVLLYLPHDEYKQLSVTARNQLALDRYLSRDLPKWEIGRFYERYLGYLWEKEGWRVLYHGAIKGFDDFGRDLICSKGNNIEIVQAKCWSSEKVIHEKHIFQLYGTCIHYMFENPTCKVTPVFAATVSLTPVAAIVSEKLSVRVMKIPLDKSYPIIKCNIKPNSKERIYHLPFDQQYDRTVIGNMPDECYASTVHEAETLGFRRAWRFLGLNEFVGGE